MADKTIETQQILRIDATQGVRTLRQMQAEINQLRAEMTGLTSTSTAYQQRMVQLKAVQGEYNRVMRLSVAETKAQKGSYADLNNQLAKLKEQWKMTGDAAKRAQLGTQINRVKAQLADMDHSIGNWQRNVGNYWGSLQKGLMAVTGWITAAIVAVRKFGQSVKVIAEFEQSIANLGSILGATNEQMRSLEQSALHLGGTTEWTASQVVLLQTELAKLGFAPAQIENMQAAVLQFATATGADLPRAAAFAGSALRAFGLQSRETTDLLNVMAKATTASALDFNKLETAISVVAPIAKSFGLNARDTAALLGTLANAGFDASTAATALRNILLEYSKTGGKVQETLGRQVGSFSELVQSFRDLRQQGMGVGEAFDLVGKRSAAALVVLTSMVDETQSLRDNLENVDGALSDIQSRRLDTLQGETKLLKSAWEDLNLSLSNSKGFLRDIVHWTTAAINGLNQVIFRDARLRASQSRRQAEITQIYDTQGAQAAVAAAYRASVAAYKAWDEFRNLSPMERESKGGNARLLELREEMEAAREVHKAALARQRADAEEEAKAAKAAELAALQEKEEALGKAQEKADKKRLKAAEKAAKEREKVFQDEVAALEKELAAEDAVLYAGLVKENKTWEKGIEQRERDAERMRRAMLGVQMGRVGERADLDVARASLEITDEKERAARIYEIRKKANEDRLALLKDYGDKAAKAGRLEEALEAQRQYHDVEVQMEADAIAEKIRLRKKDAEDEKKRYAATTKALQGVAAITGNVASAYEGYIQTRLEAGQITQEEAEAEFKHVKELQYAQTWINTLAGMVSVWAGEGTNAMKALLSASVLTQGIAATAQIAATNLGSTASAAQAVTGAAVAAPVIINQLPQVQAMTSASQEERLNERTAAQRVYVVYSDIAQAGRRVQVTENEGRF